MGNPNGSGQWPPTMPSSQLPAKPSPILSIPPVSLTYIPSSSPDLINCVKGIDVSHYETNVNMAQVLAGGNQFCFMKCTEGNSFKDPLFSTYWTAAKSAGLIRGAYHFFHPDIDATVQAQFFLSTVGTFLAGDCPPILDLEITGGCTNPEIITGVLTWLAAVQKVSGLTPMLYGSPSFLINLGLPIEFKQYPLWLARYTDITPPAPSPWTAWTFWQNSESGTAQGVSGGVDTNYFNGTLEQLKGFCNGTTSLPS